MIKPEQIPDAAIAGMKKSHAWSDFWSDDDAKDMVAAAINSWPDMRDVPGLTHDGDVYHRMLHLPVIPKEKKND